MDIELIKRARASAQASGRPVMAELEVLSGIEPRSLLRGVAEHFRYSVIETAEMLDLEPVFDVMPLARAQQRGAILLRRSGTHGRNGLVAAIADPFDQDLQIWIDNLVGANVDYRIALASDIHAYLTKQEESMRAMDNLLANGEMGTGDAKSLESLSFASVSDAASPAVKLVELDAVRCAEAGCVGHPP
ncbi:MAG: hypothetical protein QM776_18820 [Rhodocyclaceae bacterium]